MKIVEVETAPAGYEVTEVTDAKDAVMDIIQDTLEYWGVADRATQDYSGNYDAIAVADMIVEKLIEKGWRPTEESA